MPVESLDLDDLSMNGSESVDNILLDAEMMTGSFTEQEMDSAWDSIQNIVENKNVDKSRTFIVKVGMTTRDRVNHFIRLNKEKKKRVLELPPRHHWATSWKESGAWQSRRA